MRVPVFEKMWKDGNNTDEMDVDEVGPNVIASNTIARNTTPTSNKVYPGLVRDGINAITTAASAAALKRQEPVSSKRYQRRQSTLNPQAKPFVTPIKPFISAPTVDIDIEMTESVVANRKQAWTLNAPTFLPQYVDSFAPVFFLPSGSPHPLYIPEILLLIFSYLESPLNTGTDPTKPLDFVKVDSVKYSISRPKLHSVALVNKLWNSVTTKLLWKNIKIGSEKGIMKFARTLREEISIESDRSEKQVICWGSAPKECQIHTGTWIKKSPVNNWVFGQLVRSFTLIPPHGPASETFSNWNVDGLVQALALACPNLEDLNLSNCPQVTDASIPFVAEHCRKLRRINLNRCDQVSSESVFAIARNCPQLEIFNLSRPLVDSRRVVSDDALLALVRNSPRMMELRLRNCDQLTDNTVIEMAKTCGTSLLALDLSWCAHLSDRAFVRGVALYCPNIQSLALNGCKQLTDNSLSTILSNCPKLASLSLAHLGFISDNVLQSKAQRLSNLVILSLNGCVSLRDDSVIALAENCPNLQSLSLFQLSISDEAVISIATRCRQLTSLSISGCYDITDRGAKSISGLTSLQSLYLNGSKITDESLIVISESCRYIRALSLNECRRITDRGVLTLAENCRLLQSVSMNQCNITAVSVQSLMEKCLDLRELSVKKCIRCIFDGAESSKPVRGTGGMHHLSAIGEQVLKYAIQRRLALLRGNQ